MARVVVIGGGVVGLSCAYYLLKDGHSVTILDRDGCTKGASWGNAGMIVPSHFEPMANPAMVRLGRKLALQKGSPFGFGRLTAELASWSMEFYAAATNTHLHETERTILDLNLHSKSCYYEMLGKDLNLGGLLMVCKTTPTMDAEGFAAVKAQQSLGLNVETLNRFELAEMGFDAAAAIWFRDDACLTPYDFLPWLRGQVTELGGEVIPANVQRLGTRQGKVAEAVTDAGDFAADEFVLAAGAWSGRLSKTIGRKLLIMPGRGYGFTVSNPPRLTSACAILVEARIATTPMSDGQRFTSVMEIGAWDSKITPSRLDRMRAEIPRYMPDFARVDLTQPEVWVGHRPCSFDGVPFIGRFHRVPNLIAATGHGMMGMSLGPGTGRLVSQIIGGQPTDIDLRICRPDRPD